MPSAAPRCKATTAECCSPTHLRTLGYPPGEGCRCNKDAEHKAKKHETDHGYKWATEE